MFNEDHDVPLEEGCASYAPRGEGSRDEAHHVHDRNKQKSLRLWSGRPSAVHVWQDMILAECPDVETDNRIV